jgi:hypothetical protein
VTCRRRYLSGSVQGSPILRKSHVADSAMEYANAKSNTANLIVGANTRVEVEHQKRQNSKHHRKQGQRRAIGAIFCEREAEQNNREHEGGIAKRPFRIFPTPPVTESGSEHL